MNGRDHYYPGDILAALEGDAWHADFVIAFGFIRFDSRTSRWAALRRHCRQLRLVGNPFIEVPGAVVDLAVTEGPNIWACFVAADDFEQLARAAEDAIALIPVGATRIVTNWPWAWICHRVSVPLFPRPPLPVLFTAIEDPFTRCSHRKRRRCAPMNQ